MLNKKQWVTLLENTGLNEDGKKKFHQEFEKMSGKDHQEFMEILGIDAEEIKSIRDWSK